MSEQARYSVGIDLGTTHCVISYLDLQEENQEVKVLPIAQLTQPGVIEEKNQLPSFLYMAHSDELNPSDISLPWDESPDAIVGSIARQLGQKTPIRLVSSAKSWLCHGGIDRHSDFLPAGSPEEVKKISPLEATFEYLDHLRKAWDHKFENDPLTQQQVTITIPASFDPAARELTAEAAQFVGFDNLTLLEEPQAALYNWVHQSGDQWRDNVKLGDVILVVDVGGGTTDLSLVSVGEDNGALTLNRIAVGDHILLGGDNMDLALAYRIKAKLAQEGKELQPWQVQGITHACRDAKEQLLVDSDINEVAIVVPSRGSKLLGSTIRTNLTREEVQATLVEGFFPKTSIDDAPKTARRSALTQKGLPYAQDPAISRHLAAFLTKQADAQNDGSDSQDNGMLGADPFGSDPLASDPLSQNGSIDFIKPTAVLFNGGVLKAPILSERILGTINQWLVDAGSEPACLLTDLDLDLAVSCGASYFGYTKQNDGVRIRGGLANSYYVGIESAMPAIPGMEAPLEALCIAPFGMEEGTEAQAGDAEFGLVVGEPVHFRFFGSSTRRNDSAGTQLDHWQDDELNELPELEITLDAEGRKQGEVIPVRLATTVTEVGTLKLEAIALNTNSENTNNGQPERWHIEFDVRD